MSSRSKTSNKSHCDHFASDGSSSQHENVVPKVEFTEHPIDPEEVKKYWAAMGHVEFPTPGICHPAPWIIVRAGAVRMGLKPFGVLRSSGVSRVTSPSSWGSR
ncbi:hypothetical protein F2Q68_00025482 [Brassica cretica]|uniref:Uncharacterized protein n=1 Tax=Brassica cretica TaxID=69181 RepID=A0A8S9IDS7_BRACR|nr:hypothetical protein F2Q68_00025482 [Brassica cretica]